MVPQVKFSVERPEQSTGFMFWQVTNVWQRRIVKALEPLDLTHVQFVLLAGIGWLSRATSGSISQTLLAEHSKTDIMMTSKVVRTLEQKGLITRQVHRADPRAKSLELTQKGAQVLAQALKVVESVDNSFFECLKTQSEEFLELLQLILQAN